MSSQINLLVAQLLWTSLTHAVRLCTRHVESAYCRSLKFYWWNQSTELLISW